MFHFVWSLCNTRKYFCLFVIRKTGETYTRKYIFIFFFFSSRFDYLLLLSDTSLKQRWRRYLFSACAIGPELNLRSSSLSALIAFGAISQVNGWWTYSIDYVVYFVCFCFIFVCFCFVFFFSSEGRLAVEIKSKKAHKNLIKE